MHDATTGRRRTRARTRARTRPAKCRAAREWRRQPLDDFAATQEFGVRLPARVQVRPFVRLARGRREEDDER